MRREIKVICKRKRKNLYIIFVLSYKNLAMYFDASLICKILHDHSIVGMRYFKQLSPNLRAPLMRNTK